MQILQSLKPISKNEKGKNRNLKKLLEEIFLLKIKEL